MDILLRRDKANQNDNQAILQADTLYRYALPRMIIAGAELEMAINLSIKFWAYTPVSCMSAPGGTLIWGENGRLAHIGSPARTRSIHTNYGLNPSDMAARRTSPGPQKSCWMSGDKLVSPRHNRGSKASLAVL